MAVTVQKGKITEGQRDFSDVTMPGEFYNSTPEEFYQLTRPFESPNFGHIEHKPFLVDRDNFMVSPEHLTKISFGDIQEGQLVKIMTKGITLPDYELVTGKRPEGGFRTVSLRPQNGYADSYIEEPRGDDSRRRFALVDKPTASLMLEYSQKLSLDGQLRHSSNEQLK